MKGFIEVTLIKKERKVYINVRNIESISVVDGETRINMIVDLFAVKETYAEIKQLIEEATSNIDITLVPTSPTPQMPYYTSPYIPPQPFNPNTTICNVQPEVTTTECVSEILSFEGTKDALNNLGVRKEEA